MAAIEAATAQPKIASINGDQQGNGNQTATLQKVKESHIIFADNVAKPNQELLERYESHLQALTAKFKERIELNAAKYNELRANKSETTHVEVRAETGEVITWNLWGRYKWWDIYAAGPYQNMPPAGMPAKIIASGELVYFYIYVVTNPLFIDGIVPPSAMEDMAGRQYNLRLETLNLTTGVPGPVVQPPFPWTFPGAFPVQGYIYGFVAPPVAQGRPELLEVNITADVLDPFLRLAAFASQIWDPTSDPGFPGGVATFPHLKIEQPLRCLCYRRV